ncbi:hypothetical protein MLD38_031340 [Melastoma candidum]|uniref:Uncharacterized protein n=1 Tax=Melastoma candidum TaxID=119954 RepID=A0ACB9MSW5_9MYRT|nr:hypothetical protein MLD38_031340 [Melastoma candidum]
MIFHFFFFLTLLLLRPSPSAPASPSYPCKPPNHNLYPFCDSSLPIPTRASSLLSFLTLPDKLLFLSDNSSSLPRIGLTHYEWWSESLHGLAPNGPGVSFSSGPIPSSTVFPQVILATSSFNRRLWYDVATAIAAEARAMHNYGQAGLTFWAPNVNLFRDPRWGRGQETPGEDPAVAAAFASEYVKGLQGMDEKGGLMVSACCKHFAAYDLEKWGSFSRYNFNAVVTQQDMQDTYDPPFRSCIQQGKASCLMCSYNAVNGVPACASKSLLDRARKEWGFQGYITSDCDAVATIFEYQHYVKSAEDAAVDAIKAGVDINCGTYLKRHIASAIRLGKLKEKDLDSALLNLFSVQLRLGYFDGNPRKGKYGKLGPRDVCSAEHRNLALESARQGIVLLKNENKFLPLKKNVISSLAVVGPQAKDASNILGDYTGVPCNPKSIWDELKEYVQTTNYASGCDNVPCTTGDKFGEAVLAATKADFTVVITGLDLTQETEDLDRVSLLLPGKQMELVSSIATASRNAIVLVLTGGGPIDVSFAKNNPKIASILWIGYPGEAGPRALAEVIFGDVNPGGRLPITWYPESFTSVPMNDMNMRPDPSRGYPGRTYRFYTGDVVYGFGHGLSYTDFRHEFVSAPRNLNLPRLSRSIPIGKYRVLQQTARPDDIPVREVQGCDSLKFTVDVSVSNSGDVSGSHVVMLFWRPPGLIKGAPRKQLVGFDRIHVPRNRTVVTTFWIDPCDNLSIVDEYGDRILALGQHALMVENVEQLVSIEAS